MSIGRDPKKEKYLNSCDLAANFLLYHLKCSKNARKKRSSLTKVVSHLRGYQKVTRKNKEILNRNVYFTINGINTKIVFYMLLIYGAVVDLQ